MKGIAYVGALEVLDSRGILQNIERVAGTSAGAMMAVLVGMRYTAEEVRNILWKLNFKDFMDDSVGVVRDTKRLMNEYGWYQGYYFRNLIASFIQRKTGNGEATFEEIANTHKYRDIYLVGADLSTGLSKMYSALHTPKVKVADAARVSMSIPLFFAAKRDEKNNHVLVDGGLLDNYSVKTFDQVSYLADRNHARRTEYYEKINELLKMNRASVVNEYVYNKETLGFRLDAKEEIAMYLGQGPAPCKKIDDFLSYTKALVTTLIDSQNNTHLHSDDWQRTVYIDTLGVGAVDFDINDEMKKELVKSGKTYAEAYFQWYDNDEEKANK